MERGNKRKIELQHIAFTKPCRSRPIINESIAKNGFRFVFEPCCGYSIQSGTIMVSQQRAGGQGRRHHSHLVRTVPLLFTVIQQYFVHLYFTVSLELHRFYVDHKKHSTHIGEFYNNIILIMIECWFTILLILLVIY